MQNLTLSITQLNNYIKNIFDNEELLIGVSVYGEVTNFKISNGIAYFDIKEEGAQLSCVKFSSFFPFAKNGDKVLVTGKLNYHVKLGRLSFVASKVEQYGMGELYKKFLELKARLEAEGLFDASKKKSIPKYVNKIGVVTSPTGAVIRDIYHVTRAKNPNTDILVYPAKVQGYNAELEIQQGIEYFNTRKDIDVIIIARGGGSFEDLTPFNTEIIARAIAKSELPVISAVGHETDFSISDFCADLRAPTPSVAAELAVYNYNEEIDYINQIKNSIETKTIDLINKSKQNLTQICQSVYYNLNNKLEVANKDCVHLSSTIYNSLIMVIEKKKTILDQITIKVDKSNPLKILKSGYTKTYLDKKVLDSVSQVEEGQIIKTIFQDGAITSKIEKIEVKGWHTNRQ